MPHVMWRGTRTPGASSPDRMEHWGQDTRLYHFNTLHPGWGHVVKFKNANVFHLGDMYVLVSYPDELM